MTCHRLVTQLLKDDQFLNGFNGQKLRLLAYETILYLVEVLDTNNQSTNIPVDNITNKSILSYLE